MNKWFLQIFLFSESKTWDKQSCPIYKHDYNELDHFSESNTVSEISLI